MTKSRNETSLEIRRVVEFSDFFYGETLIDVSATLKHYSRNTLVRMATILSLHYGNLSVPDDERSLFSVESKKHIPYLNKLFKAYYKRIGLSKGQKVQILTYRTGLELWRRIFAIRADEFRNDIDVSDVELHLFKVILTINEKLVSFNDRKGQYKLDELVFLNGFLTNDSNNYDIQAVLQPQMYYFQQLINYIPTNEVLSKASERVLSCWGIESWQPYYTTIVIIAHQTDKYYKDKANGVPIITPKWMEENKDSGFLSPSLIEHLCIDEDEYIPYVEDDNEKRDWNTDYRRFRSKPFVKLKNGSGYVVINNQLLCERLFNSLYFDFLPLINGKKNSCGFFDYNKDFIERVLFRNTFFKCLPTNCYTFPKRADDRQEAPNEPDFYCRTKQGELIIVECKAIKMNGECRDDGDYKRLLDELHEKIVLKTRNIDPKRKAHKGNPEPIGVGQLIHHIDSIDADAFQWDADIPDEVAYYPILVFEDVKLVQTGILPMVNRWFYEEIKRDKTLGFELSDAYMPVMVVSINTLYLYDKMLRSRGLTNVIDAFVRDNAVYNKSTGVYTFSEIADFDGYLRRNKFIKSGDAVKWITEMMNNSKANMREGLGRRVTD